jgi:hypothetical protein
VAAAWGALEALFYTIAAFINPRFRSALMGRMRRIGRSSFLGPRLNLCPPFLFPFPARTVKQNGLFPARTVKQNGLLWTGSSSTSPLILLETQYKRRYLYIYEHSFLLTHAHTPYSYEHIQRTEPV